MKQYYFRQSMKLLALSLLGVVAVNVLSYFVYHRFDLTQEKRYTLTASTRQLLRDNKEPVMIEIYLEGKDLPAGIRQLRDETREMLQEFRSLSNGRVTYRFVDIQGIKDQKQREDFQLELVKKGLRPTQLEVKTSNGFTERLVFPGAIVRSGSREVPVLLLENQFSVGAQGSLNHSVSLLEYKLANSIQKVGRKQVPKIAFLQGHGEAEPAELQGLLEALAAQSFDFDKVELNQDRLLGADLDILVVAKPQQAISDAEKFLIDQYVMHGGKILWMLDYNICDLDSFKLSPSIVAVPRELNLDDLLFRYGVRMEHNLVLDLYCNQIPIIETVGGNPQPRLFPWVFYPMAINKNNHPVVKNLDPVALRFCSGIDTLNNPGVKKTILLTSSMYARTQQTPFQIYLEGAKQRPDPALFNQKDIPLAVLLEGEFTSLFKNQLTTEWKQLLSMQQTEFRAKSPSSRMIVVGDGDVGINDIDAKGVPLALGYDKYSGKLFANKDFLLNCIEYLVDDHNLIEARNREIKMRLLDKAKLQSQKGFWQVLTLGLPLLLVGITGLVYTQRRKRKYAKQ